MTDPRERYVEQTPRSAALHERAEQVLPGGDTRSVTYHRPYPSYVDRAEGCRLWTADGEELVDFLNNYTQAVLGHAPPAVVDAVSDRFRRGNGLGAPTEAAVALAERLVERVPSMERVRFANSGTEATMNAVRAAMAHTGNERVLKVRGGYHGTHDTVEVAVADGKRPGGIPSDVADRVGAVPFNDADALVDAVESHDDLACLILEPVLGAGGMIPATPEYLRTARDLTRDHDVPLVFDEVMTLRLAEGGAQERYGVTPDLTATGKLVGGGLPVGAFGGRADLMSVFHPEEGSVSHSGTFNGNPATMAGGAATLDALDADAIARLNDLGDGLRERLRDVVATADVPLTVTGDGSLFQVHATPGPVVDAASAAAGDALVDLFLAMRTRGVFLAPRGMGNLSTPMGTAELDRFVAAFEAAVAEVDW